MRKKFLEANQLTWKNVSTRQKSLKFSKKRDLLNICPHREKLSPKEESLFAKILRLFSNNLTLNYPSQLTQKDSHKKVFVFDENLEKDAKK